MYRKNIARIAKEILDWDGPSGLCWCEEQQRFLTEEESECEGCISCEPLEENDTSNRPPSYLRRKDITW